MSTSSRTPTPRQVPAQPDGTSLLDVVALACRAPSIHNTQPWSWRVTESTIELFSDQIRRLRHADPLGRNLALSCGAALHHAQVAARGLGWEPTVETWPSGPGSDLVARISLTPATPTADNAAWLRALRERRTDRRRFTSWPVRPERLRQLVEAARERGADAVPVTGVVERLRLERLVDRARLVQAGDPLLAEENRRWVDHGHLDGVPARVVPVATGYPPGRGSRFADGLLEDRDDHTVESSDGILVLCSADDDGPAWVTAGEALSATWLQAVRSGLSLLASSQVIEVDETRLSLRHQVLQGVAAPQLLVRVGWQPIGRDQLAPTPRRVLADVLRP